MSSLLQASPEHQLAARLMLGDGDQDPWFQQMVSLGLGGIIFFRADVEKKSASQVLQRNQQLRQAHRAQAPVLWLGLDQEGGQVERLPQAIFPALSSPLAIAKTDQSEAHYQLLSQTLAGLGYTLNFIPTLDVNLTPDNPIIGVRAFGEDPQQVWQQGQIALSACQQAAITPVIKHFPGHGNGTVDSHERLPTLVFSDAELWPFRQAIDRGAPVVMVSHGYYPALDPVERPATLSPAIATDLLRQRLGFTGISMTDDMEMGAVWGQAVDPVETAIEAMNAGMDMLLYRHGDGARMSALWQGLLHALKSGRIDPQKHRQALTRIQDTKARWPQPAPWPAPLLAPKLRQAHRKAEYLATAVLAVSPRPAEALLQETANLPWTVVLPRLTVLPHYKLDVESGSPTFEELAQEAGLAIDTLLYYDPTTEASLVEELLESTAPSRLVVLSWLPHVGKTLLSRLGQVPVSTRQALYPLSVHAPIGVDGQDSAGFETVLNLHSFRQPHQQAMIDWLLTLG